MQIEFLYDKFIATLSTVQVNLMALNILTMLRAKNHSYNTLLIDV